jgi:integrase
MSQKQGKARYHSGGIYRQRYANGKVGRIFWARWREVVRRPGGVVDYVQHRESTGSEDPKEAQRYLNKKLLAQGGPRPKTINPAKVTYEDIRDNRLANAVEENKLRSLEYHNGKPTLQTHTRLDAFFSGWKAADITTEVIRRFRKQGIDGGLSNQRLNRYVAELSKMFHDAVHDGLITSAEMPLKFPKTQEKNEAKDAIYIEKEQYNALRKELSEPLRSAFVLGYHYTVRVYEMRRLRWRDINMKKRIVTLPGSITKSGKPRIVPLPKDFGLRLGKPDDLVFPLKDIRDPWRSACVKVGVGWYECRECGTRCEGRKCPTHGLLLLRGMRYGGLQLRYTRHTAVRNMSDSGLQEGRIMAISGHATRSMFDRYNIGKDSDIEEVRRHVERR